MALLLDEIATAASGAYSLRKLRAAYAGNCIRVRRFSDNVEEDFGFVDDVVDTAGILAWAGAATVRIVTWYDQSGNGIDAPQTAIGFQVATGGTFVTIDGKPAADAIASMSTTASLAALFASAAGTALSVYRTDAVSATDRPWTDSGGRATFRTKTGPIATSHHYDGDHDETPSLAITLGAIMTHIWQHKIGTLKNYVNGGTPQTIASGTTSGPYSQLHFVPNLSSYSFEFVFFSTNPSDAELQTMLNNQSAYYGHTVTPIPGVGGILHPAQFSGGMAVMSGGMTV